MREQMNSQAVLLPGLSGFFRSPSLRDGGCGAGDSVVSIAVGAGAAAVVVVDVDSVLAVRRMRKRRKGRRMSSRSFLFVAASRPVTRVQTAWICCDSWVRRSGCCCIFLLSMTDKVARQRVRDSETTDSISQVFFGMFRVNEIHGITYMGSLLPKSSQTQKTNGKTLVLFTNKNTRFSF